jgi:hypothetical protein
MSDPANRFDNASGLVHHPANDFDPPRARLPLITNLAAAGRDRSRALACPRCLAASAYSGVGGSPTWAPEAGSSRLASHRRSEHGRVLLLIADGDVVGGAARHWDGWTNEIIQSRPPTPLASGDLDAVLIMNAITSSPTGGDAGGLSRPWNRRRLVIIDQVPADNRLREPRDALERAHELGSWFAVRDLLLSGFRIVRLEDPFITAGASGGGGESGWWLLVAER